MWKKVLIVDDDSFNLYLLENILKGYGGFEVILADNGEDALLKARLNPPDLIVSDILMPVMDGFALCRECKSDGALKDIPFVFYTATYTEAKDEAFALSLGAERFILKPQDADILMSILTEVLEGNHTVKQAATKPLGEEMEFFRQHNDVLFRKLEKKMSDLETTNHQLSLLEEKYRLSFKNVTDVIYMIDADFKVLSMSPSAERLLGYKPEEFIGGPVHDLINKFTSESYERAIDDLRLILKGETVPGRIYKFVAKDGTIKYLEINGSPIMRDGQVAGTISVARDITERKRAEDTIRDSQQRLSDIIEFLPDATLVIDKEGKVIAWNRAIEVMTGVKAMEMLGKGAYEYAIPFYGERRPILIDLTLHPRPEMESKYTEIQRIGDILFGESYTPNLPSGNIHLSATASVLRDVRGEIVGAIECIRDSTERKQLEEDRQQSFEKLRKTLGGTVHAIVLLVETRDPYTAGHQSRVADLAHAIAGEMGLSKEQSEGLHIAGKIHDIGKVSVPAEILSMPRKLTDVEFSLIKNHAQSGYDIMKDIEFPWPIARMILEHHERMDGSGYPNGLTGGNILLESRILSVADVVEAMASHRPYRPAIGIVAALEEIDKNKGTLYDNAVSNACLRLFREKGYKIEGT